MENLMRKLLFLSLIIMLATNLLLAQQSQMELAKNIRPLQVNQGTLPPAVIKLNIVKVKAPDINCFFDTSCIVKLPYPADTDSAIKIAGANGSGFLQTRVFQGQPNSPAAGLYAYEYRVSLENISAGSGKVPTFTSFTINFGPIVDTFDFNKDGKTGDYGYVVTEGTNIGTVIPSEAIYDGSTITFKFNNPRLAGGSASTKGQNSFLFGLLSTKAPRNVGVRAVVNESTSLNLSARAPLF
jgi:hypothetical protein